VRGNVVALAPRSGRANRLLFRQLFEKESSTYSYLLADAITKEAVLIDPADVTVERDLKVHKHKDPSR